MLLHNSVDPYGFFQKAGLSLEITLLYAALLCWPFFFFGSVESTIIKQLFWKGRVKHNNRFYWSCSFSFRFFAPICWKHTQAGRIPCEWSVQANINTFVTNFYSNSHPLVLVKRTWQEYCLWAEKTCPVFLKLFPVQLNSWSSLYIWNNIVFGFKTTCLFPNWKSFFLVGY